MSDVQTTVERMAYKGRQLPSNVDMLLHLGIEHDDMFDTVKMHRVNSVIDYFKQYEDGMAVLRRVAIKTPKEQRVDRLWEYMTMRKQREAKASDVQAHRELLQADEKELQNLTQDLESME